MGKRNAAAAIVDADRLPQFESPPKRMKHHTQTVVSPVVAEPSSPNDSASEFSLSKEFVDGTKLMDLTLKQWRIGKPIGKGSFGEIFLASDDIDTPVTSENAKYVVKIEPHSNGPLFVEIHCLLNTAKRSETCHIPPGMPEYIASGSHIFKHERYRFLILKRYQRDLHSLIKNKRVNPKSIPVIACQILDVLEHLHDQGYVHSDIKAENLMIGTVEKGVQQHHANWLANGRCGPYGDNRRMNGVGAATTTALPEGKPVGAKRGRKPAVVNGVGPDGKSVQENGLYHHQEQEMCTRTRNLRPLKTVTYRDLSDEDDRWKDNGVGRSRPAVGRPRRGRKRNDDASFSCSISPRRSANTTGYAELCAAMEEAHRNELKRAALPVLPDDQSPPEERIYLIDFGLASRFVDSMGQHRLFCMDQRRAHDGTLEFTSRDAHMGAHARRSDLECLGYNLVYWSRGFLPWKDEKLLNQPEQVHRMKEYFMTDVREMLRLIYGDDCPAYLGEFLAYVGNLTYDERPDYQYCKSLFCKELKNLGCPATVGPGQSLRLDVESLEQHSTQLTAQDEAEITNKINHVKSLMKSGGALFPYRESTLHSKASSPKNLRSKRTDLNGRNSSLVASVGSTVTDGALSAAGTSQHGASTTQPVASTNATRKKEKQFSCEEIFATDADQIARERVEKEYERAEQMEETVIRYTGKPTYAIQELLERKSRGHSLGSGLEYTESDGYIKGYTKPMMDILRKRQSQLFQQIQEMNTAAQATTGGAVASAGKNGRREKTKAKKEVARRRANSDADVGTAIERDDKKEVEVVHNNVDEVVNEEEDEDEAEVKLSKYEQDDDYEQDEESVEDEEDEEEEVGSEIQDDDEMEEEEEEDDDEEDEEEQDDDEEEEDEEEVIHNGYEAKGGAYRRKKESKGRKKEDTDSDFINDGGCEEDEEGVEDAVEQGDPDADGDYESDHNLAHAEEEDEEDEEEEDDEDQQDSDFNDQESTTATESEDSTLKPVKRKRGRPVGSGKRLAKTVNRAIGGVKPAGKSKTATAAAAAAPLTSHSIHDNDGVSRRRKNDRSGYRKKKHHNVSVMDDGEGDNAQLFEGQLSGERHHQHREETRVVQTGHHHYNNNNHCNSKAYYGDVDDSSHDVPSQHATNGTETLDTSKYRYVKRRKSGLRERIRPTDRGNDYADNMQRKRKAALQNKQRRQSAAYLHEGEREPSFALEDDYSCSSTVSSRSSVSQSSATTTSNSSTSHSVASSSCNRALLSHHSSSAASLASSSISTARKRGSGGARNSRKAATVSSTTVSSRDSSRTRVRHKQTEQSVVSHGWSRSNSSNSTSRSSSVSASANGGGGEYSERTGLYHHNPHRLSTLSEQREIYGEEQPDEDEDDDGDDTRDADFSPVCTRRRRKASATVQGTEVTHNGGLSRKTKRDYVKGTFWG
uniref:non-specific serine/threonine protein kinase n=1 Tax=Anopheles farauti TaxID=69004 RepID=A0A182QYQ7_9DIPT